MMEEQRYGAAAWGADRECRRISRMFLQRRKRAVDENDGADRGQAARGAERDRVVGACRGTVDPVALGAVEGKLLPVEGEEVLTKELAKPDEQIPESPDNWIVAADRVFRLTDVGDEQENHEQGKNPDRDDKQRCEEVQAFHHEGIEHTHRPLLLCSIALAAEQARAFLGDVRRIRRTRYTAAKQFPSGSNPCRRHARDELGPALHHNGRTSLGGSHRTVILPFLNTATGWAISAIACSGDCASMMTTSAGLPIAKP